MSPLKKSSKLFSRAENIFVGGVNSPVRAFRGVGGSPLFMERGAGPCLWDADGNRYIDYVGSWGPMILGHAVPSVVRAAQKAAARGSSFGAPTAIEIEAASLVQKFFPNLEKIRFVSSGTEACMGALRLARGVTGRDLIVKFSGAYHGHSDGLLVAAGSGAATFGHPDSAGVPDGIARLTIVLPYNDAPALKRAFAKFGRQIAAVIIEPIGGNMGVVPARPDFLRLLRTITQRAGALLIFDEVMTGFRVSSGGAQKIYAIEPDLTALGKIIGAGFPVGAFGGPKRYMDKLAPLGPVYQAGTLSGNPVAMAAGAALLKELQKRPVWRDLAEKTEILAQGFEAMARRRNVAVTVNRTPGMFTIFFTPGPVTDLASAMASDKKKFAAFFHSLLAAGVYFPPSQFEAAFVSAAHGPREIADTLRAADKAFKNL